MYEDFFKHVAVLCHNDGGKGILSPNVLFGGPMEIR